MKTVRITDEVWEEIAKRGKFGETEDDVLRRIFAIGKGEQLSGVTERPRTRIATIRMTAKIFGRDLYVEFANGQKSKWALPERNDKESLRRVIDSALTFARKNGATIGQLNAVRKTLTNAGYHLTKS